MDVCGICMSPVEGEIVRLKCNDLHFFCNDCIIDWYKELKRTKYKNMYQKENEFRVRMCPICREDGGLLPLFKKEDYIASIHEKKLYKKKKEKKVKEKKVKEKVEKKLCDFEMASGKRCTRLGGEKYGGRCFQHANPKEEKKEVKVPTFDMEDEVEEMINPTDETTYEEDLEGVLMDIEDEWVHAIYELNELEEKIEKGESEFPEETKESLRSFMDFIHLYQDSLVQQLLKEKIEMIQKKLENKP
jgi:hypothetical protein